MMKWRRFSILGLAACLALLVGLAGLADHKPGHSKGGGGGGKEPETLLKVEIWAPATTELDTGPTDAEVRLDEGCFGVTDIDHRGRLAPLRFGDKLVDGFTVGGTAFTCLFVTEDTDNAKNIVGVHLFFNSGECHPRDFGVETDFVCVSDGSGGCGAVTPDPTGFQIPIEKRNIDLGGLGEISVGTFNVLPCTDGEDCSAPFCVE